MGQAVKPIQDEMDLTNTQYFVLMAFHAGICIFEVPDGIQIENESQRAQPAQYDKRARVGFWTAALEAAWSFMAPQHTRPNPIRQRLFA